MEFDVLSIVQMIGGLALFIYGMTTMGKGLERAAGSKLEKTLEKMTGNVFTALIMGMVVTMVIQSSSATTVMVVGFVNAGIMTLKQSVGVILGANIGTTVTAQILRLSGGDGSGNLFMDLLKPKNLAYIIVLVGVIIMMLAKKRRTREAPTDPAAYSEWLYQQGEDPETQHRRETMAERAEQAPVRVRKRKEKTQKKKGGAGWRILLVLVILLALGAGFFHFVWAKQPKADDGGLGARKKGCSTILIAGTDEGGYRTDTMMLFSVDREAKTMSLVSIPRDTLVYCEYSVPKLNSACGWAGGGDDGMQELLTRVEEIVGFRPDGYVVTDLACFEELVDLMGGVTFDVPVEMHYSDPSQNFYIDLSAGEQKLDGAQAMQLVRFRSGYADADLGRVKVQRDFLAAALHQWASVKNVYKLPSAIRLITEHTKTDLTSAQLAWLAESAALCGTDGLTMATMPGSAAWIGGGSYYVLDAAQVADLVNEKLNPYQKEVTVVDLAIRAG